MDLSNIIRPGDDPLSEEPTYTITLTVAQALAVKDAVACLWTATQPDSSADDTYAEYGDCGFMAEAHAVADQLTAMLLPYTRRCGAYIRMLTDGHQRQN